MFLLVTGASGAGKSTVRRLVTRELSPEISCVELRDVVSVPRLPDIAWRQQATEAVVARALELQAEGRHLLLSGDPVARDPRYMPHVLSTGEWPPMRWERWKGIDPAAGTWGMHVLDTSAMTPGEVAMEVVAWSREALRATAPVMHATDG